MIGKELIQYSKGCGIKLQNFPTDAAAVAVPVCFRISRQFGTNFTLVSGTVPLLLLFHAVNGFIFMFSGKLRWNLCHIWLVGFLAPKPRPHSEVLVVTGLK